MKDGNKKTGRICVYCLSVLLCVVVLSLFYHETPNSKIERMRNMLAEDGHIIHSGGFLETSDGVQVTYTNSLEALENLYEQGNRFCEIDLQETVDGMVICGHGDENELVFGTGLPLDASGEDFLNSKIYGEFTPISLADLTEFMKGHSDLTVITDVKTDNVRICRRLAEEYPTLRDRFIVQIQLPEEYDIIRSLGFRYIMYPIFRTPDSQRDVLSLAAFARRHELVSLIVPNGYYSPDSKLRLASGIIGVPIVLHTLNDDWEMSYYLNHGLALAVYTDRTDCNNT